MTLCSRIAVNISSLLAIAMFGLPCCGQTPDSLRIVDVVWGFDDRVAQGQFVPLSILVDNLSDLPVEGTLRLNCVQGMLNTVGGDFEEPLFLAATSRRWFQFYPFISESAGTWQLVLQTAEKELTFDPIPQSRRIFEGEFSTNLVRAKDRLPVVILDPPNRLSRFPKSLKHMPEEIFPPYATATRSLYALFLDHVPNWDVPRQEALMSWLRSGGRLHVLKDSNNQDPRFQGAMSALNEPMAEFYVGFGLVTRYDYQREGLPESVVEQISAPSTGKADLPEGLDPAMSSQYQQLRSPITAKSASEFFVGLRELTNPEHNWVLLAFLALIYVGLLFPGSYILSKQPKYPFYTTYGAIVGAAFVFSTMFLFFGKRGYDETTAANSLMTARYESNGVWEVFGMTHIFVTSGDEYSIKDKNHETLFASGSDSERVAAQCVSGNDAQYLGRIPPYSGQPVVSRRRLKLEDWNIRLVNLEQTQFDLKSLSLETGPKLPTGKDVKYRLLHGRRVYTLAYEQSTRHLVLTQESKKLIDYCHTEVFDPTVWGGFPTAPLTTATELPEDEDPGTEFFRLSEADLLTRSLQDDFAYRIDTFELPIGQAQLLIYAPIPPALELPFSAEASRDGRILYVYPIKLDVSPQELNRSLKQE